MTAIMIEDCLQTVALELAKARGRYPPFASAHEGYAILLEEMDELKAEVWKSAKNRDSIALKKEAVQVAAMALRFLVDIC